MDSDDPYLMAALAKPDMYDLVVMHSSRGNVIVMSRSFHLSGVAHALIKKEPLQWHYNPQRNILSNGTESVDVVPTGLPRKEIECDISLNIVLRN